MVVLRCTRKLLEALNVRLEDTVAQSTNLLGEWYANLVPTIAGDLVVFANARTLLSVAIPTSALPQLVPLFTARVYNLLRIIDVPVQSANIEIAEYKSVLFAKTADRRVLGCLNEIAQYCQFVAEGHKGDEMLSLMNVETELSQYLFKLTGYRYPAEIALELLTQDQMPLC
jgi:hypothetical protein